jgi:hypothetical protein
MVRPSPIVAIVALVVALGWHAAGAQQRLLLVGNVQWTSANRVQLITDSGLAVNVDASRLDQTSYTSLRSGDRVRVVGYLSPDRRVVAESLELDVTTPPQTP